MTQIKIGSRVVTRKFEDIQADENYKGVRTCNYGMIMKDGQEGIVTRITKHGSYEVHGYYWPPSAVELVSKEWEPEYGKEYEFSDDGREWVKQIFAIRNPIEGNLYKYLAVDKEGCDRGWKYVRPIRRTLEEKLREWANRQKEINPSSYVYDYVSELMEIFNTHRQEVKMPSDEEILQYFIGVWANKDAHLACVDTVFHFLALANETNGKK